MDVETYNAAKAELEQAYLTHMIDREEYYQELKGLRKERQDDREALLLEPKPIETEKVQLPQRRLYSPYSMKLYRSRRPQIFISKHSNRHKRKRFTRRS